MSSNQIDLRGLKAKLNRAVKGSQFISPEQLAILRPFSISCPQLVEGKIYVTRGGLAKTATKVVVWGYERVRILKKFEDGVLVETTWGSELEITTEDILYSTQETEVRSEFPLVVAYLGKIDIPFTEALSRGLCKEKLTHCARLYENIITTFVRPQKITEAMALFDVSYYRVHGVLHRIKDKGYNQKRYKLIHEKRNKTFQLVEVL